MGETVDQQERDELDELHEQQQCPDYRKEMEDWLMSIEEKKFRKIVLDMARRLENVETYQKNIMVELDQLASKCAEGPIK